MNGLRIVDDQKRELLFLRPPRRIVSLVPSDTLSLFALGAGERVVGRTRYCVAPAREVEALPLVGGTKDVDVEAVAALAPDLVVANQEENAKKPIEELIRRGMTVYLAFPKRVVDGLAHLARLARILGLEGDGRAKELVREGYQAVEEAKAAAVRAPLPLFLPIWMDPLMTISGDTYISDVLALCGARNVFANRVRRYPLQADLGQAPASETGDRDTRYPRVALSEVEERAPEAVLLPDEPHAFSEQDAQVFRGQRTPAAARGAVRLCGGRDLSWYGAQGVRGLGRVRALVDSLR